MKDNRIDILRFVGLAMIIFAHVDPPGTLLQLRNFDVPLMVLASAMSFGLSYKASDSYLGYVWKRIKRLVFPVWIFLTVYFIAQLVIFHASTKLNWKTILASYTLIGGIGYVWIIRVFLMVALVSPFLWVLNKKILKNSKFFLLVTICFFLYELLRYLALPYIQDGFWEMASLIVLYIIPYSITFSIGLRMITMKKIHIYTVSISSLEILIFIGEGLFLYNYKFIPTQAFKYPPSIYYFSYALFVSSLLWIFSKQLEHFFKKLRIKNTILFIASNSMWIYLWHIPLVKAVHNNFLLKYLIVFSVSVSITYAQTWFASHLLLRHIHSDRAKRNIKTLLTG